ncbi:MAG TPA: hypothetical protein VEY07_03160 [Thermoplasmata archaeon]|nr:hypothetical protein [Thermoplasmata archaeon]
MFVLRERERIKLQTDARYDGNPGVLTVTDQRVVFTRRRGRLSTKVDTAFSVQLEEVSEAREHPKGGENRVEICTEATDPLHPSPWVVEVSNAVHIGKAISALARGARAVRSRSSGPTPPVQVDVHVPALPIQTVILVRCPFCRTAYPELDAKCPSCGAPF